MVMPRTMHSQTWIGIALGFLLVGGCDFNDCQETVDDDFEMQFVLRGGFVGVYYKLVLDKAGSVEAHNGTFLVSDSVSAQVRKEWQDRLNDVDYFCLDNDYPPTTVIADGFDYELTVVSHGQTKTISAADEGGYPAALHELFWDLYYNLYVPTYQDSATVGTLFIWQEYSVQPWPFTEQAPLTDNVYTEYFFSEIDSTGEIARYLNDLYYPDGDYNKDIHYLLLAGDHLYRITMIEDGFKINSAHPVRYWPQELNVSLRAISDEGVIIYDDLFRQVKALLIEPLYLNSIFVESLTADEMTAYYLTLVNGVPAG